MQLPVADARTVRTFARGLLAHYRVPLAGVVALQALAAIASLAVPWVLGDLVDEVAGGTTGEHVNTVALVLAVVVLLQTALTRYAQRDAMILGEEIFARLREQFLATVTHLPLSTVERAGTGDLLGRTTNDVDRVQWTVRFGVPRVLVAGITVLLTVAAAVLASPPTAVALLVGAPVLVLSLRWYLRRASPAYRANAAAFAGLNGTLTESVEQAATVDAL
ncbi:ABC transporter ATP-binding protein, partial [Georgenia sp. 10Sc9-8]|nr:ABC transporter ATP-binding protein [Georgenia halotolerans]